MVKRFERETYIANIGVNRGAGFTSAAATARRQAGDIEQIFTQFSNDLYAEAVEKGEKRGKKAANEQEILYETIINPDGEEVSVAKKPIKPKDLVGKSAVNVYERLSTERYVEDLLTTTSQIIDKHSADAQINGADEAKFASLLTQDLETIYKNIDPSIRQLVKLKDRAYMQDRGKYVNQKFLENTYKQGLSDFQDFEFNANKDYSRDILYGTADSTEHYSTLRKRLDMQNQNFEISDIIYQELKDNLKIEEEADRVYLERFKPLLPYNIEEQNDNAEKNAQALYDFFNITNKEIEIELIVNGKKKTFTREQLEKGLTGKQIDFLRNNRLKPFKSSVQQSNSHGKGMATVEQILNSKDFANAITLEKKREAITNAGPDGQKLMFEYFIKQLDKSGTLSGAKMSTDFDNQDAPTRFEFTRYKVEQGLLTDAEINTLKNVIENKDIEGIMKHQVMLKLINEQGHLHIHLGDSLGDDASELVQILSKTAPRSALENFYQNQQVQDEKNMPKDLAQNYKRQSKEKYQDVSKVADEVYKQLDAISSSQEGKSVYFGTLAFNNIMRSVHKAVKQGYALDDTRLKQLVKNKYEQLKASQEFGFSTIALPFERILPTGDLDDTKSFVKHPPENYNPIAFSDDNINDTRKIILQHFKTILGKGDNVAAEQLLEKSKPLDFNNIYLRYRISPSGRQEYVIYYREGLSDPISRSIKGEPVTISVEDLKEIYND